MPNSPCSSLRLSLSSDDDDDDDLFQDSCLWKDKLDLSLPPEIDHKATAELYHKTKDINVYNKPVLKRSASCAYTPFYEDSLAFSSSTRPAKTTKPLHVSSPSTSPLPTQPPPKKSKRGRPKKNSTDHIVHIDSHGCKMNKEQIAQVKKLKKLKVNHITRICGQPYQSMGKRKIMKTMEQKVSKLFEIYMWRYKNTVPKSFMPTKIKDMFRLIAFDIENAKGITEITKTLQNWFGDENVNSLTASLLVTEYFKPWPNGPRQVSNIFDFIAESVTLDWVELVSHAVGKYMANSTLKILV